MNATTKTRTPKTQKPIFPVRVLLAAQQARLLVIDGEAFAIKGREHKYIKAADYAALIDLGWITAPQAITEDLLFHTVSELGRSIIAEIEEQNRKYHQLELDLDQADEEVPESAQPEVETSTPALIACSYCGQQTPETAITIRNDAQVCAACIELDCGPLTPDDFAAPDGTHLEIVELVGEIILPDQAMIASQDQPANPTARPDASEIQIPAPQITPVFDTSTTTRIEKRAAIQKSMQQSISDLLAEIKAGKSERLLDYLKFAGKFHTYSPLNQLLIASQAPHATRVAGYSTWKKLGYQVKKGSRGIAILTPRPYGKATIKNEETGEESVAWRGLRK